MNAEFFREAASAYTAAPQAAVSLRKRLSRRLHRWVSIIFTITVALNVAVMAFGAPPAWITYAPLPPLLILLITGLTMLVSPWARALRP